METWNDAIDEADERYKPIRRLLEQHSTEEQNIIGYYTYGSALCPMAHSWARIEGAVYIQDGKQTTEYHTIVAVPEPLTYSVINNYELTVL